MNRWLRGVVALLVGAVLVAPGAHFNFCVPLVTRISPNDYFGWLYLLAPGFYVGLLVGLRFGSKTLQYFEVIGSATFYAMVTWAVLTWQARRRRRKRR